VRKLKIFGFIIDGIPEQLNFLFDVPVRYTLIIAQYKKSHKFIETWSAIT